MDVCSATWISYTTLGCRHSTYRRLAAGIAHTLHVSRLFHRHLEAGEIASLQILNLAMPAVCDQDHDGCMFTSLDLRHFTGIEVAC